MITTLFVGFTHQFNLKFQDNNWLVGERQQVVHLCVWWLRCRINRLLNKKFFQNFERFCLLNFRLISWVATGYSHSQSQSSRLMNIRLVIQKTVLFISIFFDCPSSYLIGKSIEISNQSKASTQSVKYTPSKLAQFELIKVFFTFHFNCKNTSETVFRKVNRIKRQNGC